MAERFGGPIDPYSPHGLRDVLEGNIPDPREGEHSSVEYEGMHIQHQGNNRFHVQLDGHAGCVMTFHSDDYHDVLELISDLNEKLIWWQNYDYREDKEGLVEWAGKIMTSDEERAADSELYVHIPER